MTEIEYVKQRITALRMKLRISERQLSGMLGKSPNYIGAVLDQKIHMALRATVHRS